MFAVLLQTAAAAAAAATAAVAAAAASAAPAAAVCRYQALITAKVIIQSLPIYGAVLS